MQILARSFVTAFAAMALVLALCALPGESALACSDHELRVHLSFNHAKKNEEWGDWKRAFEMTDVDGDGIIRARQAATLFQNHFNILHDKMTREHRVQISRAEHGHFSKEAAAFLSQVKSDKKLTYDTFMDELHKHMGSKQEERMHLLDVAQHIYS